MYLTSIKTIINQLTYCRMSSRDDEMFLEDLNQTRRLERGSSEESSESANGREPSEGSDEVAQTECLDSPKQDPQGDDHPQGAVEENPMLLVEDTQTARNLKQLEGPPTTEAGPKRTWKERENLYRKIWQYIEDLGC